MKITCTSCSWFEIVDGSISKNFLITYFIGRVDVAVALTPIVKSLVFPIASG
jgi:hypothetical protein